MTERTHDELERLILGYEGLDGDDLARADAHLADCAACRALLASLQRVEREARPRGSLPPLDDRRLVDLEPALRSEAEASLARLLARAGAAPAPPAAGAVEDRAGPVSARPAPEPLASSPRGPGRVLRMPSRPRRTALLVPAAAAVIAVVLWPRPAQEPALLPGAAVVPGSQYRGEASEGFRTGDAFALQFELARPAQIALVHLDPAGHVSLLIPDAAGIARTFPAGRHRVPTDTAAVEWRFEGPGGRETFLLAAADRGLPRGALSTALARLPAAGREERIRDVQRLLERRVGGVQAIEVEHRP